MERQSTGDGFLSRKTFRRGRCQDLSAQVLYHAWPASLHRHLFFFFLGPKGRRSSALGRNARPARFRPGLVEECQGWDESFFSLLFFPPGLVGTIE